MVDSATDVRKLRKPHSQEWLCYFPRSLRILSRLLRQHEEVRSCEFNPPGFFGRTFCSP
jgi:hypothetical protein